MLSLTTEYALRAVVCLADDAPRAKTTQQIADASHAPAGYLSKVMQMLGRAGIVTSQRGMGGGFVLARDAADITVEAVVSAVDPLPRIRACPLGYAHPDGGLCALHCRLDSAMEHMEDAFRAHTIAEMLIAENGALPMRDHAGPPAA